MKRIVIALVVAVLETCTAATADAQLARLEGYDGYTFGMTVEQALKVHPGTSVVPCDYPGTVGCLKREITVAQLPGQTVVLFAGQEPRVTNIHAEFNFLPKPGPVPCKTATKTLLLFLVEQYGPMWSVISSDMTRYAFSSTWRFPERGVLSLQTMCVGELGGNMIVFDPKVLK